MTPWEAALEGWLSALRDEMRLSAGTLVKYSQAASEYARSVTNPLSVREPEVRRFLGSLRHLSPSTVRVHLAAIKSLHQWLDAEHSCGDPTRRIKPPRRPDRLPRCLSEREAMAMLNTCRDDYLGIRDRAILETLYSTGCRANELLTADCSSLRLDVGRLNVIGKGNRERVCLLGPDAVASLVRWLQVKIPSVALFLSYQGNRLSRMGLWKMIRDRGIQAGIERHVHPHMFRHACASHMLRNGADLRSIQLVLGHRSLASTQVYLSVEDEHLRAVHAQSHPRGRTSDPRLRTVGGRGRMDDPENEAT
jgi:site-specific recombinase XerD